MSSWNKLADHLIRKELGDLNPAQMERVKAQVTAGEPVRVTYTKVDGKTAGDAAAPDVDWFDKGD